MNLINVKLQFFLVLSQMYTVLNLTSVSAVQYYNGTIRVSPFLVQDLEYNGTIVREKA